MKLNSTSSATVNPANTEQPVVAEPPVETKKTGKAESPKAPKKARSRVVPDYKKSRAGYSGCTSSWKMARNPHAVLAENGTLDRICQPDLAGCRAAWRFCGERTARAALDHDANIAREEIRNTLLEIARLCEAGPEDYPEPRPVVGHEEEIFTSWWAGIAKVHKDRGLRVPEMPFDLLEEILGIAV